MSEFTKGPWSYDENFPTSIWANNVWLASTNVGSLRTPEETAANARLIAAAPDLLKALSYLVEIREIQCLHQRTKDDFCAKCMADAAIAKAEGRS